jgi:SAM-dependent methyltransferase
MAEPGMAELAKAAYFDVPEVAARRYRESREFAEILRLLGAKRGRALDLGAGNGILSWALAREGWAVTAVEPDPSDFIGAWAIRKIAADTHTPITVIEAFGEAIPVEDAGFDLIVARQVLHHANDLPAFCREMARLARPGARVLTLRDHVVSSEAQKPAFLEGHPLHRHYGGENAFMLSEYQGALEAAGIKIDQRFLSFQSVLNFDPSTPEDIMKKMAGLAGPLSGVMHFGLTSLPQAFGLSIAALADRRPGRLVSYLGHVGKAAA